MTSNTELSITSSDDKLVSSDDTSTSDKSDCDDNVLMRQLLEYLSEQSTTGKRATKYIHNRIDWDEHVDMLCHTNDFQQRYHMTEASLINY